jgi:ketosteroid isomerase-like protein
VSDEREAIRALTYEYTFRLDRGDFAAVAELLGDGVLRMAARGMDAEPIRGRAAVERFYAGQVVTYDGDPRTRHLITNHVVDIAAGGATAKGRCYFTVLQAAPKQPIQTVVSGRYADSFEKTGDTWRFAEKVIEVDYLTAIGDHFKIDDEHAASGR